MGLEFEDLREDRSFDIFFGFLWFRDWLDTGLDWRGFLSFFS